METSAKTNHNVELAFITLSKDIKRKVEKKMVRIKYMIHIVDIIMI